MPLALSAVAEDPRLATVPVTQKVQPAAIVELAALGPLHL